VPFPVHKPEDLFVRSVKNYASCDRFKGTFPQPWNMGEQFRCDSLEILTGEIGRRYQEARDFAVSGEYDKARSIFAALDTNGTGSKIRALINNDLSVIAAIGGNRVEAMDLIRRHRIVHGLAEGSSLEPEPTASHFCQSRKKGARTGCCPSVAWT
jgi:hypothetical protein